MTNRFTKSLENLALVDAGTEYERFSWGDLIEISPEIYHVTAEYFFSAVDVFFESTPAEFACRWMFLCFIAAMSDEDIDELVINHSEPV